MTMINVDQLREVVRAELKNGWASQKAYAEASGISSAYLSDFLNGRREPGDKMLDALGFERIVQFRRKTA